MALEFESGIPMVAASFTDIPVNMDTIHNQGLDIAEIRVDLCKNQDKDAIHDVLRAFQSVGFKTMLTVRSMAHGGRWTGTHSDRLDLILHTHDAADIIDIEDDCDVPQALRDILDGPLLLISHHNMKGTPTYAELCDIRERALEKEPDLIKIATHVRKDADLMRLAEFLIQNSEDKKLIVIGMGGEGLISRISFPGFGSPITFCYRESPTATGPTAKGQLTLDVTVNLLRIFYPKYNQEFIKRLQSMQYV